MFTPCHYKKKTSLHSYYKSQDASLNKSDNSVHFKEWNSKRTYFSALHRIKQISCKCKSAGWNMLPGLKLSNNSFTLEQWFPNGGTHTPEVQNGLSRAMRKAEDFLCIWCLRLRNFTIFSKVLMNHVLTGSLNHRF